MMLLPTRISRRLHVFKISARVLIIFVIVLIYVSSLIFLSYFSSKSNEKSTIKNSDLRKENNDADNVDYIKNAIDNANIEVPSVNSEITKVLSTEQPSEQQLEPKANSIKKSLNVEDSQRQQTSIEGKDIKSAGSIPSTEDIIDAQRQRIALEMKDYNYTVFTPENNGKQIQNVIFTSWRSGSTFLGAILSAMPGTFYHFEPLAYHTTIQIRGPPKSVDAINTVSELLKCNYTGLNEYLRHSERPENRFLRERDTPLWNSCDSRGRLCWDPNFLNPFCRLFPIQTLKIVRLRAALAEQLITNPELNVRVVLLIRDPRGIMHSRKHFFWCDQPDCNDASIVCKDMVDDFTAAKFLMEKYPLRFKAVRYEDLSLDPYNVTKEIFSFYGLPFDENIENFLYSHTHANNSDLNKTTTRPLDWTHGVEYSTFRDSKATPFRWIHTANWNEIEQIQKHCVEAISLWGYKLAENGDIFNGTTFNPLLSSPFANNAPTDI